MHFDLAMTCVKGVEDDTKISPKVSAGLRGLLRDIFVDGEDI